MDFSNSGAYGTSIPYQRVTDPSKIGAFLNLESSELLRIQRYNEAWRFFFGKHWTFRREDGEPLVTVNYVRKIVEKSVDFLAGNGFTIQTPAPLEEVTLPFLNEVWEYNNRDVFLRNMALMGAVTGDAFVLVTYEEPTAMQRRINPFTQGRIKIQLLGSEQVFCTWDPLDVEKLISVRIETLYYEGRVNEDEVNNNSQTGATPTVRRFTQIITADQIFEHYQGQQPTVKPNVLGEISIVHIQNYPVPKEFYGLPDATSDLLDLQREFNEKKTDVSDIINYHASPVTIGYGVKAKQLERGPRNLWTNLPKDSKIETLNMQSDLGASNNYISELKKSLMELSDTPEGAFGAQQPISNTSGVALHMGWEPLIGKTNRKTKTYGPGLEQVNYFVLRIGTIMGLINLPYDICKCCGGRIVEVQTDKTTRVWNQQTGSFDVVPVMKRKCYEIDKQTLDFVDPADKKVKFWRQYGFGAELRTVPYSQVIRELTTGQKSFWDYSDLQEQVRDAYTKAIRGMGATPEGEVPGQHQEQIDPETGAIIPAEPPKEELPKLPPNFKEFQLGPEDIEIPEEPEQVEVRKVWLSPTTGELVGTDVEMLYLVPTGCLTPKYLNPFENTIEFPDPLPKDKALQATLFRQYQESGWVDEEWCQARIPEIAEDAQNIRKRMKALQATTRNMPVQQVMDKRGADVVTYGAKAPKPEGNSGGSMANTMGADAGPRQLNKVPGPGGNPTNSGSY